MPRLTKEEKEKQRRAAELKEEALRKRKRVRDEITAVIIMAVGLFLVISMFTSTTGAVGAAVKAFLGGLLGWVAYILPFFLIVYGVLVFLQKTSYFTVSSVIACIVLFILLTCFVASIKEPLKSIVPYDFSKSVKEIYDMGVGGGGIIGVYVGGLIKNFIGQVGLIIVCIAGVIIALLLILNTPLSSLIDNAKMRRKAHQAAKEESRSKKLEQEGLEIERREQERIEKEKARAEAERKAREEEKKKAAEQGNVKQPKEREIQEKVDTDSLPTLDMNPVRKFNEDNSTEQPAEEPIYVEPVQEPVKEPIKEPEPTRFTPEDIGLKSPEKTQVRIDGITENQQKVLDLVMDDDLFKNKDGSAAGTAAAATVASVAANTAAATEKKSDISSADKNTKTAPNTVPAQTETAEKAETYKFPPVDLLSRPASSKSAGSASTIQAQAQLLEDTLLSFGVQASVVDVVKGPAVTRFEVKPATGVKVSKIEQLHDDLALNLRAKSLRIEAPIPGKAAVGIEVSNDTISTVTLREIIESEEFKKNKSKIAVAIGRSIGGDSIVADLKAMPHLLVAGSTGSGKSVCINSMLISLLYKAKPEEVKLILIDPKVVELSIYNGLPHLMIPVVTDAGKASAALGWAVSEMNDRYNKFANEGVRDLQSYNESVLANGEKDRVLPQIVIVIDELAELIMTAKNTVEDSICRIAQKARAAGMHLIVATQRPSTDVITGVIKANIPSRIAFAVSSQTDSRVILDVGGAENLLGKGDMLYGPQSISKPLRVQGCFVSDNEVRDVINYVKSQVQMANYNEDILHAMSNAGAAAPAAEDNNLEDELLTDAIETVVRAEQCSVSMLQRRFRIGYNRAARLVDLMEERGIVGPADGARPRKVNMTLAQFQDLENQAMGLGSGEDVEDLID